MDPQDNANQPSNSPDPTPTNTPDPVVNTGVSKEDFAKVQQQLSELTQTNEDLVGKVNFYQDESKKNQGKFAGVRDRLAEALGINDPDKKKEFDPKNAIDGMTEKFQNLQSQLDLRDQEQFQRTLESTVDQIAKAKGVPKDNIDQLKVMYLTFNGNPDYHDDINPDAMGETIDALLERFPNLKVDVAALEKEKQDQLTADQKAEADAKSASNRYANVGTGIGDFVGAPNIGPGKSQSTDNRTPANTMQDANAQAKAKLMELMSKK